MKHGELPRRTFLVRGVFLSSAAAVGMASVHRPRMTLSDDINELTFSDHFLRADSASVGNGWLALRGGWSIVSDSLQPTGNQSQMEIAQTAFELGRRFTVEGKVNVSPPGGTHNGIAFNIHDLGNGNQNSYALTLMLGSPSVWALWEISNSEQRVLPAFEQIDIAAGRTYTLRATAARYGSFEVAILDGSRVLVSKSVRLDPFNAQLAGGFAGAYSQAGNADGTFAVDEISVTSSTAPAAPPSPPADRPLVCVPVQGPPYQLPSTQWNVVNSSLVDETQAFVAVGQTLITDADTQYVAYYDANRQMTVAQRSVDSDSWVRKPLNAYVGNDGHNSVTMALDRDGQLHVVGDMHNVPLIYFRTAVAGEVTSLTKIDTMVDPATEQSETYPVFLRNANGQLIYNYRSGVSGNGATYYNIYDESSRSWSRLLDRPLFDGQGAGNAYPSDPALGPDGYFHMVWVWRATGDAATDHNLSYARSKDLVHWETVDGAPLTLPITQSTSGVVVDPVPTYGGLLNGSAMIGFDADKRVLVSYFKLDKKLDTQVYVARRKRGDGWAITQVSPWTGRYFAQGIGTIPAPPLVSPVSTLPDGNLRLAYSYATSAASYSGTWILDPRTLIPFTEAPLEEILRFANPPLPNLPAAMTTLQSTFPGMAVQLRGDSGSSGSTTSQYFLRYEALPAARSSPPYPNPSRLQVYLVQSS